MMKLIKWPLIISVLLVVTILATYKIMRSQTKKHSPEQLVEYTMGETELSVFYNRPYKKGRKIFGELVPYDEVWRTGANEPTTFITTKDITLENQPLPKGEYTVWTIPGENELDSDI